MRVSATVGNPCSAVSTSMYCSTIKGVVITLMFTDWPGLYQTRSAYIHQIWYTNILFMRSFDLGSYMQTCLFQKRQNFTSITSYE